jgi:hypothetical protein
MLVMPRLIGWQGGEANLTITGSHKKMFFFLSFFPFFTWSNFNNFFQKEFQCGDKIKMCGLDVGKEGISSCNKMPLEWYRLKLAWMCYMCM